MSHDLKTPLTVINNSLYILERITDPASQQDKIKSIRLQTRLLEKYIQDILTISRLDHLPELVHETVNLNTLLGDVAERLRASAEEKKLTMTLDLDQKLPTISGDQTELNRVFINLVENALQYTAANGSIALQTRVESDFAVIEVADSGMGIPETDLLHIFERFYRSKEARAVESRGTGLGLAIVRRIIEMHSGKIEVDSVLGQGTTFRVYLPTGIAPG
jgi:two-component system phosphate regulon sensor histidine kinase PhoR